MWLSMILFNNYLRFCRYNQGVFAKKDAKEGGVTCRSH